MSDLVAEARALEADAVAYPEERGEILLEAAAAWRRAGRPARAAEVLMSWSPRVVRTGASRGPH